MLELFNCRLCGGELQPEAEGTYRCTHCGRIFIEKAEEGYISGLKKLFDEEKLERISAARLNLWDAMHKEYIDSASCIEYARELKKYLPQDYYANFSEIANGKNDTDISKYLNNSSKEDIDTYADAVLDFMIMSMTKKTFTAVCNYIDRAYAKSSPEYVKYQNLFETEAQKIDDGIYEPAISRDVFVAYSSIDTPKVVDLCEYLENQGISCFLSMRNLRHGRCAVDNYDDELRTAMDNCSVFVFMSSRNSRNFECDALRKEIPYLRDTDKANTPSKFKNLSYGKIPYDYKKNRVELLIDEYERPLTTADKVVKEFFDGLDWCNTYDEIADRVVRYLTVVPENIIKLRTDNTAFFAIEQREKKTLNRVASLIAVGEFRKADSELKKIEKVEVGTNGVCSAAVYYYKILVRNKVSSDDELIEKYVDDKKNLLRDKDYIFALSIKNDTPEKAKLLQIEKTIEEFIRENEKKAKREEKEEAERQRKIREEAEAAERERRNAEECKKKEEAERQRKNREDLVRRQKEEKERRERAKREAAEKLENERRVADARKRNAKTERLIEKRRKADDRRERRLDAIKRRRVEKDRKTEIRRRKTLDRINWKSRKAEAVRERKQADKIERKARKSIENGNQVNRYDAPVHKKEKEEDRRKHNLTYSLTGSSAGQNGRSVPVVEKKRTAAKKQAHKRLGTKEKTDRIRHFNEDNLARVANRLSLLQTLSAFALFILLLVASACEIGVYTDGRYDGEIFSFNTSLGEGFTIYLFVFIWISFAASLCAIVGHFGKMNRRKAHRIVCAVCVCTFTVSFINSLAAYIKILRVENLKPAACPIIMLSSSSLFLFISIVSCIVIEVIENLLAKKRALDKAIR